MKMAKKLRGNHYLAPSPTLAATPVYVHRTYSTDGEDHRAPSERTVSEYITTNDSRLSRNKYHNHNPPTIDIDGSDIYVTSAAYRAPSEISRGSRYSRPASHLSYKSGRPLSEVSTVKTKTSRKGGLVVETMAAPNPFCPNTKGICCLMLLLNLGLILVTLGFVVVLQFFHPLFVWILGIVFLIFGFLTLIGSLIYCVFVCRDSKSPKDVNPEELYWTHHWQKTFGSPEINYRAEDKYHDDRYSDRFSVSKFSNKYSDRGRQNDRY